MTSTPSLVTPNRAVVEDIELNFGDVSMTISSFVVNVLIALFLQLARCCNMLFFKRISWIWIGIILQISINLRLSLF